MGGGVPARVPDAYESETGVEQGGDEHNLTSCGWQCIYRPGMSPPSPEKPRQTTHPGAGPRVGSDGASVCPPVLIEVNCRCGRRRRVHAHDTMAYAQACMD